MSIPTILVIEDNLADIEILRFALDAQGEPYRLEILTDGEAALVFVAEHRSGIRQHDPCVILLDFKKLTTDQLEELARALYKAKDRKLGSAAVLTHVIIECPPG